MNGLRVTVVPDSPCPECGAYWGHPDPALDFPNRVKVDHYWKCFNPGCTVAYYTHDGIVVERTLPPEEEAAMHARVHAEVAALMERTRWISRGNTSRPIPKGDPLPEGWTEGVS